VIKTTAEMDRTINKGGRRRRYLWIFLVLLGLAAVMFPRMQRWASAEASVALSDVRVGTVVRGDLVRDVAVQGNVVAAFRPTLVSPARGMVRFEAEAGDNAEAGQVLARVSSPELESRVRQERSTLAALRSEVGRQRILAKQRQLQSQQDIRMLEVELEAGERALERAKLIREEGLLNAVEMEKAEDAVTVSSLQLDLARQRANLEVETLEFELSQREADVQRQALVVEDSDRQVAELAIRAPVACLVSRIAVADRDSVAQGQELVTVVDLSAFVIEVLVPESSTRELGPGTPAVVMYDGFEFPGTLDSLSPEVRGSQVQGVVVFSEAVPEGLKQNQRVTTRLLLDSRIDVLKLPRGSFLESGGGRQAYLLEGGLAVRRPIEVGASSVAEVEVLSGLTVGDRIILSDTSRFEGAEKLLVRP